MPSLSHADQMLCARWIIPMEGPQHVLDHHTLIIQNDKIVDILPTDLARQKWQADRTLELDQHALIPGLINSHTHAAMNLFRGLADDLPLMTWLEQHIWPAESQWVSEHFIEEGTRLAIAEMIRSGTTCFADMYFFPDRIARAAVEAGIRTCIFSPLLDFPTPMGQGPADYLRIATQAIDQWRHEPLVHIGFGPHAPYTVSDGPLERMLVLAEELDVHVMMHVHETAHEVEQAMAQNGVSPLVRLEQLGLLSPRLLAVHMTQLTDEEIQLVAHSGTHVVHCPESNLKLASGFCPVERLRQAGIKVALGTDGAASNNDLDMLSEMRTAALLAKGVAQQADALPACAALEMATLNGARALGIDQATGSLVPDKAADITAIDLGELETQPLFDPIAHIVYCASRHQVSHVWAAGRCLLDARQLTTLNEARVLRDARKWAEKIKQGTHHD